MTTQNTNYNDLLLSLFKDLQNLIKEVKEFDKDLKELSKVDPRNNESHSDLKKKINETKKKIAENQKKIAKAYIEKALQLYPEWQALKNLPAISPETLKTVNLSNKRLAQLPLDNNTLSVLCGTVSSDASLNINDGYKNARFQLRHSTRQYTWFTWKCFVALEQFTKISGVNFSLPDGYQAKSKSLPGEVLGKLKIASTADPILTELRNIICVGDKVKLQRFWLNHMNNYFLMTVWLDDGSLMNGRQGVICFNSYSKEEQQIFREYLLNVWGIKTRLENTGKTMANGQPNYRICILDQDSLLELLRLVAPVVPVKEMLFKVCFVPDGNPDLLQRWKTELLTLVRPEFRDDIEKYYSDIGKQP